MTEAFEAGLKSALRALGRGDYSESAMRALLAKRGYEEDVVEHVLEDLHIRGLVNDESTIGEVAERAGRRGYSRRRAFGYLRSKGYGGEVAEQALESWGEDKELANALRILQKSFPKAGIDPETRRKAWGALARRGFEPEQIRGALSRHFGQDDEISSGT